MVLLATAGDAVVRAVLPGAFDSTGRIINAALLLEVAYIGLFTAAGSYVAARLAPHKPMRHALVLGVLALVFNVVGATAFKQTRPVWYLVVSVALVLPCAWLGGRLRERQLGRVGGGPGEGQRGT